MLDPFIGYPYRDLKSQRLASPIRLLGSMAKKIAVLALCAQDLMLTTTRE
jgi:hypothetical protein